jgi:N-acetylneuraminic acid mutarotase
MNIFFLFSLLCSCEKIFTYGNWELLAGDPSQSRPDDSGSPDAIPPISGAAAAAVASTRQAYVFGGSNQGYLFDALYRLDLSSPVSAIKIAGTGSYLDNRISPEARKSSCLWAVGDENLYLFGGIGYNGNIGNDLWRFNLSSRTWKLIGGKFTNSTFDFEYGEKKLYDYRNWPPPRRSSACWVGSKNQIYFAGGQGIYNDSYFDISDCGSDVWSFNTVINKWAWISGPSITNHWNHHGPIHLCNSTYGHGSDGSLWIFAASNDLCNYLWRFNVSSVEWANVSLLDTDIAPLYRSYGSLSLFGKNNILLFGGINLSYPFHNFNDLWSFQISSLSWKQVTVPNSSFPVPKIREFQSIKLSNQFFVIGGFSEFRKFFLGISFFFSTRFF